MLNPNQAPANIGKLVKQVANKEIEFEQLVSTLQPLLVKQQLPVDVALELSNVMHDVEDIARLEDSLLNLVQHYAAPAMALSETGQVLAINDAVMRLSWVNTGDGLTTFGLSQKAFEEFKQRLAAHSEPTLLLLDRNVLEQNERPLLLLGRYQYRQRAFIVVALQQQWPESINQAMQALFNLSQSECDVLAGLASGLTSEQIAQLRERRVSTVRQQIKATMAKMGVSTQVQAATLAAAAAHAFTQQAVNTDHYIEHTQSSNLFLGSMQRNGRRIGWRRFGNPYGQTVFMLHGPSFAAGEFEQDRFWASELGLDVIAIERPGYGRTTPPNAEDDPLQCQCDDIAALVNTLNLDRFTFLAHEVALIVALAYSAQHPGQVNRILGVSCAPPFKAVELLNSMPPQQGIFILAARKARWLSKLLLRLLVVRLRKLGAERWYEAVFDDVPSDLAITQNPELRQGVIAAYPFYTQQSGAGFDVDLQVMIKDWTHLITEATMPVTLLHGSNNATSPLSYLSIFTKLNPNWRIEIIENEGLTLAIHQPERIYRTLASFDEVTQHDNTAQSDAQ